MISPHSVQTDPATIDRWISAGWAYVCPDFERPNMTVLRWTGLGDPRAPAEKVIDGQAK